MLSNYAEWLHRSCKRSIMNSILASQLEGPLMAERNMCNIPNNPHENAPRRLTARAILLAALRSALTLLAASLWLIGCLPAAAQQAAAKSSQPDVLVLVFAIAGGPDQIGLTYKNTIPHSQAERDIQAIKTATGWNITGVHIADMLPPVAQSTEKMTSADFVAQGAVDPKSRYLPIEPFVDALRNYHHVTVTYLVNYPFAFEGLRQYADNHVNITLDQSGSGYTYQINYHDSQFGHLNLPRYQLSKTTATTADRAARNRQVNPWLVALVGVAAVGAGLIVYTVFARNN